MKFSKKQKETWKMIVRIIVLSVILGGVSGIFTAALTTNYLADYAIELADYTQPLHLNDEKPRAFPESYQEAIAQTQEEVMPGVVTFFAKDDVSSLETYLLDEASGQGVVLTSDGWLASASTFSDAFSQYVAVVQGEVYEVEQVVEDEVTGVSFIKVFANNLPVVSFGNGWDAGIGDQVFILSTQNALIPSSVSQIWRSQTLVHSSDEPSRFVRLTQPAAEELIGVPVANLSGELLGLCVESQGDAQTFISIESVLPSFTSLLESGEIARAQLGIDALYLSSTIGLVDALTRGYDYGALIYDVRATEQVLEIGDIILSVDGMMINESRSLDEYLSTYKIGDVITLNVDRDGVREDMQVTLY